MDEIWLRLGLIAGALAVALVVTLVLRARASAGPTRIEATGMAEGLYLFTSSSCGDCRSARKTMNETVGDAGFVEINWEEQPGIFHQIGVGAVPATMVVANDGSGTLYSGSPLRALATLGP